MSQLSPSQLAAQLRSPDVKERVLAMIEIQKDTSMPTATALPLIEQALADSNVQVRGMAVFSLGIKPAPENLQILVEILQTDSDYNMRAIAAGALGYLEDKRALEPLRHAFYEDTQWLVQFSAAVALGNLGDNQAQAVLLEALDSPTLLLQEAAISALGEIGAVAT
ncbi:MAG: HEAT repeat domain-containing protein, partial [Elainellaceae cyanobacterium]